MTINSKCLLLFATAVFLKLYFGINNSFFSFLLICLLFLSKQRTNTMPYNTKLKRKKQIKKYKTTGLDLTRCFSRRHRIFILRKLLNEILIDSLIKFFWFYINIFSYRIEDWKRQRWENWFAQSPKSEWPIALKD